MVQNKCYRVTTGNKNCTDIFVTLAITDSRYLETGSIEKFGMRQGYGCMER
ncbi:hypothetical protein SAMN05443144_11585 [Fodinibius roseus]|uniref:Uncharacterized protein n=1 Tax=Fodinibius roseus TaxID=1194090 RepID=A0A1M5FP74_9BACT|nr:hypothetical protein [Fodinibius roseus]SHF92961.1 hypothetical protein SAMN05443144_11585 [Fodinibius roseus]